ncbi:unnamed protein product [Ectocarpus sp. CCAP 1310/34]|nr:unnamed protein product [Ectocarpus sp. CCAP 1310/34]
MKGGHAARRHILAMGHVDLSSIPNVGVNGHRLWLASALWASVCFNGSATKANLGWMSPFEAFFGRKPPLTVVSFFQEGMMRVKRATHRGALAGHLRTCGRCRTAAAPAMKDVHLHPACTSDHRTAAARFPAGLHRILSPVADLRRAIISPTFDRSNAAPFAPGPAAAAGRPPAPPPPLPRTRRFRNEP